MTLETHDEALARFERSGCTLDGMIGMVYVFNVNIDGEFFGIFESGPVPEDDMRSLDTAVEAAYYIGLEWHDASGCWSYELAEEAVQHPGRFVCE